MREYQYYEFAAVDRPLIAGELDTLRSLSTRAHITPTSFVNTYDWGSLKGDPRRLVERYFDAFLYLANWGTRELMLRFPARLIDLETAQRYCVGDSAVAWNRGDHVIVAVVSEDEEADFEWGGEGVLASILPVRSELLAGDERALYLMWLVSLQAGEIDDDVLEPAVPEGLAQLTGSQAALVEFLRVDRDLVDAAVVGSPQPRQQADDVERWAARLAEAEGEALHVGLLQGEDPFLRVEALRRARPARDDRTGARPRGSCSTRPQAHVHRASLLRRAVVAAPFSSVCSGCGRPTSSTSWRPTAGPGVHRAMLADPAVLDAVTRMSRRGRTP